ncbi:hypothetical protein BH11PLA2_BH11PLA2_48510 [soil metagenome]
MSEPAEPSEVKRRRWRLGPLLYVIPTIAILLAIFSYYKYTYPYGWSHCCEQQLSLSLRHYAEEHKGWFPRGEATPEASLSLLAKNDPYWVNMMRGKSIGIELVQARLSKGQLLTPEMCGWHYVEGLRLGDDPRLALFWDKVGLGHNGERLSRGGHAVISVSGSSYFVSGADWDEFLLEQERLRPKR